MVNEASAGGWREDRRRSARDAIVDAAWQLVGEEGLAGLSLRDLARRAGITPPTVYAYFDSKNAIYDAMFGRAATQFVDEMAAPYDCDDPNGRLVAYVFAPDAFEEDCRRAAVVVATREAPSACAPTVIGRKQWREQGALAP